MPYKKEVKVNKEKGNTLVKVGGSKPSFEKIVFSFSFFQPKSITYKDFNNFYSSLEDAKKSVSDFFETLKLMSNLEPKELFSLNMKKQYHYNEFNDNKIIDRIESILVNGYNMTQEKVDEFERTYFEFDFGNGKRVIGTRIFENIFQILFIDCNHLVCLNSTRNPKIKSNYAFPSLFQKDMLAVDLIKKSNREKVFELFIEEAKKGRYETVQELILNYEEFVLDVS